MLPLIPAVANVTVGSIAFVMAVGFLIGVYGHVIRSRLLILIGIALVGGTSAYVAFGLAKLGS